jgi:hypothetical protein
MFRPISSSESNLYTIRATIGYGSSTGVLKFTNAVVNTNYSIAAAATGAITPSPGYNYLSSPSSSNLPNGFNITLNSYNTTLSYTNNIFTITYGQQFTSQPSISVVPSFIPTTSAPIYNNITPSLSRNSITAVKVVFLADYLPGSNYIGMPIPPSIDGIEGLLGFDIVIVGSINIGANTVNSNKGWCLTDSTKINPTGMYTSLDTTLGSSNIVPSSIVIAKSLKFLGRDGNIKTYTDTIVSTLDYSQTVLLFNGTTTVNNLILQKGMILILANISTDISTKVNMIGLPYQLCIVGSINASSFTISPGGTITLYGTTDYIFTVINYIACIFTTLQPPPVIQNESSSNFYTGTTINYMINAINNPSSYNATYNNGELPGTLTINTSTGIITGTINNVGNYSILLIATNTSGTGTKNVSFNINPSPL